MHCSTCGINDDGSLTHCSECGGTVCHGCASTTHIGGALIVTLCPDCSAVSDDDLADHPAQAHAPAWARWDRD